VERVRTTGKVCKIRKNLSLDKNNVGRDPGEGVLEKGGEEKINITQWRRSKESTKEVSRMV